VCRFSQAWERKYRHDIPSSPISGMLYDQDRSSPCRTKVRTKVLARVADPVHFRPDPDPANQIFKIGSGSRILLAHKESTQTSTLLLIFV